MEHQSPPKSSFNINLLLIIIGILILIMQLRSCIRNRETVQQGAAPRNSVITVSSRTDLGDGLDLEAVGELIGQVKDAADFEKRLNQPNGINNLDLNQDGVVDFLQVTEYGSGNQRGFSLFVELEDGRQEVATIEFQQNGQNADVQIQGNPNLYGSNNYYYRSGIGLGDILLLSWIFSPHPFFYSPWSRGYYPGYYGSGYGRVNRSDYRQRASNIKKANPGQFQKRNGPAFQSRTSSPNSRSNAAARRSLRNPNRSQRGFQSRSVRSSTGSRTGSIFGGGK